MNLPYITTDDIKKHIDATNALDVMQDLFLNHMNDTNGIHRQIARLPNDLGLTLFMPAYNDSKQIMGIKVSSIRPQNNQIPVVNGLYVLIDYRTGLPIASIESNAITALRTAAVSALVTKHRVQDTFHTLGIFGAGVQAFAHIEAICKAIKVSRIFIHSRTDAKTQELIANIINKPWCPKDVSAADSVNTLLESSTVICTCTSTTSSDPIFKAREVPGNVQHINVIGGATPEAIEIDAALFAKARIFVENIEDALRDSGELNLAISTNHITSSSISTVTQLLNQIDLQYSDSKNELSIYRSVGMAQEDLFLAWFIYQYFISKGALTSAFKNTYNYA